MTAVFNEQPMQNTWGFDRQLVRLVISRAIHKKIKTS